MPTLEFKGKPFVYSHHLSVPFRELVVDSKKSLPPKGQKPSLDDNLIIHGDNLEALKALLPRYAGKVDVIYIDPPYNTGKEAWAYNDNVNSPLMKEWLGRVVDGDDLERHDKWLSMMWPRLNLLHELLCQSGIILVSIDDNEVGTSRLLLDEIFGAANHVATFVWKNATDNNPTRVAVEHEYIHCYAKSLPATKAVWASAENEIKELMLTTFDRLKVETSSLDELKIEFSKFATSHRSALGDLYRYRRVDEEGPYVARRNLENPGKRGYDYDIIHPTTKKPCTKPYWGWRFPEDAMRDLLLNERIIFGDTETKIPELKVPLREIEFPLRSEINLDGRKGSNDLEKLFGNRDAFKNPKPVELLEFLFSYVLPKSGIVLDSFAGSGTTGHAVLSQNARDGGTRKFILVQLPEEISKDSPALAMGFREIIDITIERTKRVVSGVSKAKDEVTKKGLGGSFTFCELGEPLDLERFFSGKGAPTYEQVARYVVYTATGQSVSNLPNEPRKDWFVSEAGGYRIHLLYKPDLAFMRGNDAALSLPLAKEIAKSAKGKPALVYAPAKFMSQAELTRAGITFCQLPYSVHRVLGEAPDAS
jgi:adenine-specific DNA-methyltransferase